MVKCQEKLNFGQGKVSEKQRIFLIQTKSGRPGYGSLEWAIMFLKYKQYQPW